MDHILTRVPVHHCLQEGYQEFQYRYSVKNPQNSTRREGAPMREGCFLLTQMNQELRLALTWSLHHRSFKKGIQPAHKLFIQRNFKKFQEGDGELWRVEGDQYT